MAKLVTIFVRKEISWEIGEHERADHRFLLPKLELRVATRSKIGFRSLVATITNGIALLKTQPFGRHLLRSTVTFRLCQNSSSPR